MHALATTIADMFLSLDCTIPGSRTRSSTLKIWTCTCRLYQVIPHPLSFSNQVDCFDRFNRFEAAGIVRGPCIALRGHLIDGPTRFGCGSSV
jgi:hypothetical protein